MSVELGPRKATLGQEWKLSLEVARVLCRLDLWLAEFG